MFLTSPVSGVPDHFRITCFFLHLSMTRSSVSLCIPWTQSEGSKLLVYTGLRGGLEHLKIETRLIDERFCECDGWVCDLDVTGTSSIFKIIRCAVALVRIFTILDIRWEENTVSQFVIFEFRYLLLFWKKIWLSCFWVVNFVITPSPSPILRSEKSRNFGKF